jgi:hypothetical protein
VPADDAAHELLLDGGGECRHRESLSSGRAVRAKYLVLQINSLCQCLTRRTRPLRMDAAVGYGPVTGFTSGHG